MRADVANGTSSLNSLSGKVGNIGAEVNYLSQYATACSMDFTGPNGPAEYWLPCANQKAGADRTKTTALRPLGGGPLLFQPCCRLTMTRSSCRDLRFASAPGSSRSRLPCSAASAPLANSGTGET